MLRRGNQSQYNTLLDAFNARSKTKKEGIECLVAQGFSSEQAKNAVHVYWKGRETRATFVLLAERRDLLLGGFKANQKKPKECVDYLMNQGCTYHQATSAVYKYRKERNLNNK